MSTLSNHSNAPNDAGSTAMIKRAEVERKVAIKILSYILVFILQWVPLHISNMARIFKVS